MERHYSDLNTYLYDSIKEMIFENNCFSPGEKINQEKLAEKLGVSRTPIIKVLHTLAGESIVEYVPRHGYYVKEVSLEEMIEFMIAREFLEGVAVKLIIEQASISEICSLRDFFNDFVDTEWTAENIELYSMNDQKFHLKLVDLSKSKLLSKVADLVNLYKLSYQKGVVRPPQETLTEHFEIISALEKRNADIARELIMLHLEKSRQFLLKKREQLK